MTWTITLCRDSKGKEYLHLRGPGQWLDVVPLRAGPIVTPDDQTHLAALKGEGQMVTYFDAIDPNDPPFFPPEISALLRFARPAEAVACAECGKLTRKMWTMLCPFTAAQFSSFSLAMGPERAPLALVCSDHPLNPSEAVLHALRGGDETAPDENDDGDE